MIQRNIDPKLLEVLVCPLTKTVLQYDHANQELISRAAGLAFPIRRGVPIMLVEEARMITTSDVGETVSQRCEAY